ncbi:hypothetical protein Leryth_010299 [Lithospermum erythrorhizon]|nr:hypothetical protein Leryth_010299 [Lithospermum erythrorhizon]
MRGEDRMNVKTYMVCVYISGRGTTASNASTSIETLLLRAGVRRRISSTASCISLTASCLLKPLLGMVAYVSSPPYCSVFKNFGNSVASSESSSSAPSRRARLHKRWWLRKPTFSIFRFAVTFLNNCLRGRCQRIGTYCRCFHARHSSFMNLLGVEQLFQMPLQAEIPFSSELEQFDVLELPFLLQAQAPVPDSEVPWGYSTGIDLLSSKPPPRVSLASSVLLVFSPALVSRGSVER